MPLESWCVDVSVWLQSQWLCWCPCYWRVHVHDGVVVTIDVCRRLLMFRSLFSAEGVRVEGVTSTEALVTRVGSTSKIESTEPISRKCGLSTSSPLVSCATLSLSLSLLPWSQKRHAFANGVRFGWHRRGRFSNSKEENFPISKSECFQRYKYGLKHPTQTPFHGFPTAHPFPRGRDRERKVECGTDTHKRC
jgi:hypothetical protein